MLSLSDAVVLVVEDNADNLFILIELLRTKARVKYVNGRASGRQLFRLVEDNPALNPTLVLLDIQIPYEDGYTVLKKIRQHPRFAQTRVLAVTANIMPQDVERTREAGFDGFIGKPIDRSRLGQQLTDVLEGKEVWEPR